MAQGGAVRKPRRNKAGRPSALFEPDIGWLEWSRRQFRDATDGLGGLIDSFEPHEITVDAIAEALGASKSEVLRRAEEERWIWSYRSSCIGRSYTLNILDFQGVPVAVAAKVLRSLAAYRDPREAPVLESSFRYDVEKVWLRAARSSARQRERGQVRGFAVRLAECYETYKGLAFERAAFHAARYCEDHPWLPVRIEGVTAKAIEGWYFGRNGGKGARLYLPRDREAALIPRRASRGDHGIPAIAWSLFTSCLMDSKQPSMSAAYRYTAETAEERLWGDVPSLGAFKRRARTDITPELRGTARAGLQEAVCEFVKKQCPAGKEGPA